MTELNRSYNDSMEAGMTDVIGEGLSSIISIVNILIFIVDTTVILMMFFRCRKFRMTRAYDDFAGTGKLAKALEIITILLAIDAVYALTRLFAIIDAVNLITALFPEISAGLFVLPITVQIAIPVISFAASLCAWNMYHNTKKLFFSMYPNGAMPVIKDGEPAKAGSVLYGSNKSPDLSYSSVSKADPNQIHNMSDSFDAYLAASQSAQGSSASSRRDEDIFGAGASVDYLSSLNKADEAKMEELLMSDEPDFETAEADETKKTEPSAKSDEDIFGTGNSTDWQPAADLNDPLLADMLVTEENREKEDGFDFTAEDGGLFGSGTSENYMKKFTSADESIISELLVQEEADNDRNAEGQD